MLSTKIKENARSAKSIMMKLALNQNQIFLFMTALALCATVVICVPAVVRNGSPEICK